jgi:uncharacterized protein (TIGR03066 family)
MFTLRFLVAGLIMVLATASGDSGEKKPDKKVQIIGLWEWQKEIAPWRYHPRTGAAKYEFTKDGKIKSSDKLEGTYELEGEILKVKLGGKSLTWTITRLNATELILEEGETQDDTWRQRWFKKK